MTLFLRHPFISMPTFPWIVALHIILPVICTLPIPSRPRVKTAMKTIGAMDIIMIRLLWGTITVTGRQPGQHQLVVSPINHPYILITTLLHLMILQGTHTHIIQLGLDETTRADEHS